MMKVRRKPLVVDAVLYTGANLPEIIAFMGDCQPKPCKQGFLISTLEGDMHASAGDWIIRGVVGEYYACKPDIFAMTYELAGETAA